MVLGVLVAVALVGAVVGAIALLVRGGRGAMEFAPRNLVRVYLYIASMAGIIVLVVGLSGILTVGFAAAFGNGFVYGESTPFPSVVACPPNADPSVKCVPPNQPDFAQQRVRELDRRRADDLIRGVTFTVFGALFWGAHYFARRGVMGADELTSGLRRGYLLLGTVIFGIATVILLPTGIYQALSYLILPLDPNGGFRNGTGDTLPGGLVTLPIWLTYLWLVVRDVRSAPATPPSTA
jgi:hypothetical protein